MSYGLNGSKVPEGYQQGRIQQFTPGQISLFQNMLGNLGPNSFLNKLQRLNGPFDKTLLRMLDRSIERARSSKDEWTVKAS